MKMDHPDYHSKALARIRSPRFAGDLSSPDLEIRVHNPACGDQLWIGLRIHAETIQEARFLAEGCSATLATADCLCECLQGRRGSDLAALGEVQLRDGLGPLPESREHALELALDALFQVRKKFLRQAP